MMTNYVERFFTRLTKLALLFHIAVLELDKVKPQLVEERSKVRGDRENTKTSHYLDETQTIESGTSTARSSPGNP